MIDSKELMTWLDSLSLDERKIVMDKIEAVAIEAAKEKAVKMMRNAAGLPEDAKEDDSEDPNEDKTVSAARKAAGVKPAKKKGAYSIGARPNGLC